MSGTVPAKPSGGGSRTLQFVAFVIIFCVGYVAMKPSPTDPVPINIPPPPDIPANSILTESAEVVWKNRRLLRGAETLAVDPEGKYGYTGTIDGRIIRLNMRNPKGSAPQLILHTGDPNAALPLPCGTEQTMPICGRPIGMTFDNQGRLLIADAFKGILGLDPRTMETSILTTTVTDNNGRTRPLVLPNSIVVSKSGRIFFTESSDKFDLRDYFYECLESRPRGSVMEYDPKTRKTTILASGIGFANGIVMDKSEDAVIVAELTQARLVRIPISGPNKGKISIYAENLPGLPDNLSWVGDEIWTGSALVRRRGHPSITDHLAKQMMLRKITSKIVPSSMSGLFMPKHGVIIRVAPKPSDPTQGYTVGTLEDPTGRVKYLAGATYHDGYVYLTTFRPEVNHITRIAWDPVTKTVPKRGQGAAAPASKPGTQTKEEL